MDLRVNTTDYFAEWWLSLSDAERTVIYQAVQALLSDPACFANPQHPTATARMCELTVTHQGYEYRLLYALNAAHDGIVLVGGKKALTI